MKNSNKGKSPKVALIIAGTLNLMMGFVECISSFIAGSTSMLLDSLDFFVDGINYFSSVILLKKSHIAHEFVWKVKGFAMIVVGVSVLGWMVWRYLHGWIPRGDIMSFIGLSALAVNLFSAFLLQKFQNISLDLRAVWLCTRNDAIGNVLIIIAGFLTLTFSSPIPDMLASLFIGSLAIKSGFSILNWGKYHDHIH